MLGQARPISERIDRIPFAPTRHPDFVDAIGVTDQLQALSHGMTMHAPFLGARQMAPSMLAHSALGSYAALARVPRLTNTR